MRDDTGLIVLGVAVLAVLYFYSQKETQSVAANTSGLNNSFPTFNLLYPISSSGWTGTYTYSGLQGGMPVMYEAPTSPNYYGGSSYGGIYAYTPQAQAGYTSMGQVGQFLGSMFGG